MLVLSRKEGETILIGDGIEIQIAAVQGNRVRIAIKAPQEIRVLRGEIAAAELVSARQNESAERIQRPRAANCI